MVVRSQDSSDVWVFLYTGGTTNPFNMPAQVAALKPIC